MRRLYVGLAGAALVGCGWAGAASLPAHAAAVVPGVDGCRPNGAGGASGMLFAVDATGPGSESCHYTVGGTTAPQYAAVTPNAFTITVTHTDATGTSTKTVVTENLSSGTPGQGTFNGTIPAVQGDTVTVNLINACDPTGSQCGGVGTFVVGAQS